MAISLKDQIAGLIELQKLDSQIYSLRAQKEAAPGKLKELEDLFLEKKLVVTTAEQQHLEVQKQRKDKELELASKEEGIRKLNSQLASLKTNKDYQAMLQQISAAKADASVIEDKILGLFDQADKAKSEVAAAKLKLQEEEKATNEQKRIIEARIKEIDERLSQLENQRNQSVPGCEPMILSQYERILANRDGLALAAVKNNACSGCNMTVSPQVINLIKMYERVVPCEVCNRILFIENES